MQDAVEMMNRLEGKERMLDANLCKMDEKEDSLRVMLQRSETEHQQMIKTLSDLSQQVAVANMLKQELKNEVATVREISNSWQQKMQDLHETHRLLQDLEATVERTRIRTAEEIHNEELPSITKQIKLLAECQLATEELGTDKIKQNIYKNFKEIRDVEYRRFLDAVQEKEFTFLKTLQDKEKEYNTKIQNDIAHTLVMKLQQPRRKQNSYTTAPEFNTLRKRQLG